MEKRAKLAVVAVLMALAAAACDDRTEQSGDVEDSGQSTTQDSSPDVPPHEPGPQCPTTGEDEPLGLLLTWQRDPTTTMTIDWHIEAGTEALGTLCFREEGAEVWAAQVDALEIEYPFGERKIYRVELTGLTPGREYRFQVGGHERRFGFRTMPADIDDEPLVFATGGDTQHLPQYLEQTNRVAMAYDLDFIAWGGDIAYADGGADNLHEQRWAWWFEANMDTLIDDDGRVVPILVGIGNHEVVDGYYHNHQDFEDSDAWRLQYAPYFYTFFAFPGHPGYASLDFGQYLSLIFLDTDHSNPVEGPQTEWLQNTLRARSEAEIPHIFPIYHFPAYPSHRDFDTAGSARVRDNWVPLFEAHGITLAFENHDHTYKRTHPIRDGQIDDDGIVYIGDGAWGVLTRGVTNRDEWYIDQYASQRHAIIVTLLGDQRHVLVVSEDGDVLDEVGEALR